MLFFTIRLKKEILISFGMRDKCIIIIEWMIGLIIYISFFYFAKEGSILHTVKSLFLG